jgi:hypothetical protein
MAQTGDLLRWCRSGYPAVRDRTAGATNSMIKNGLYHITAEMLDGEGGNQGVMVLRDGTVWPSPANSALDSKRSYAC